MEWKVTAVHNTINCHREASSPLEKELACTKARLQTEKILIVLGRVALVVFPFCVVVSLFLLTL